jgi:hypothetical protein
VVVSKNGEFGDEPLHKIDADHRQLAFGGGSEKRAPMRGAAIKDGNAKMGEVRPRSNLGRPNGRGY